MTESASRENRRISMKLRGFGKQPLITSEIALAIAKLVFTREYGAQDFELQQPLSIEDDGDTWVVEGNREYDNDAPRDHPQMVEGRVLIEVAKANGAILALTRYADLVED